MKKLIAILLAAAMLPCAVFAEEKLDAEVEINLAEAEKVTYDERFDMLCALGIIKNYKSCEEFYDIPYASRGEFSTMLASVLTDEIPKIGTACKLEDIAESKDKDAIAYLWERGIVAGIGENLFEPELAVTVEQALIASVKALGYGFFVNNFSNESYITVAQKYGFADGIKTDYKDAMTKDVLLTLFENLIDLEPFGADMTSNNQLVYSARTDGTALEIYRNIHIDEGVMTSNIYTDDLNVKIDPKGTIEVNNTVYDNDPYQDKTDFLGMNVKLYYKEEDGNKTALFVRERENKNKVVLLEAKDVDDVTDGKITYYDNDKQKNLKFDRSLKVIYNGGAYPEYELDELVPEYGSLKLIDNDVDGIYDYAVVTSYELMWLDRYSALEKKVYNKMSTGISEVSVLDTSVERNVYIEKNGAETDRFGIGAKDVLLITRSKNTEEQIFKIFASSETIDTYIRSMKVNEDGETEVTTDDGVLIMNPLTEKAIEAQDTAIVKPEIGRKYRIYLDVNGKVSIFENSTEGGEQYGYLKRIYDEENERWSAKIFTSDGKWEKIMFAEKVKYNDEFVKDERIYDLFVPGGVVAAQMVRYRLVKGEIKYIKTAEETDSTRDELFRTSGLKEFMYVYSSSNLGDRYFFNDNAKIFVIPTDKAASEDDYRIETKNILVTESKRYNMEVYDSDEFGHSSIFKLEQSLSEMASNSKSNTYYVVRNVSRQLDEHDEICGVLECAGAGEYKVTFTAKDESIFSGLKCGDIIQVSKDRDGYTIGASKLFSLDNVGTLSNGGEPDMYNVSIDISGYVDAIDANRNVIKFRISDTGYVYIKNPNTPNVTVVEDGKVNVGTIKDVIAGNYAAIRMGYGVISDIVVYK